MDRDRRRDRAHQHTPRAPGVRVVDRALSIDRPLGHRTSSSETEVLRVAAYLAQDPELLYPDAGEQSGPYCVEVESEGSALRDLADAISTLIARNDLDCPSLDK